MGLAAAARGDPRVRAGLERRAHADRAGARGGARRAPRLASPVGRRDAARAALVEPAGLARLSRAARRQRAGLRRRRAPGRRRRHRLRRSSRADCPHRRSRQGAGGGRDADGSCVHAGTEDRRDAEPPTRSSSADASRRASAWPRSWPCSSCPWPSCAPDRRRASCSKASSTTRPAPCCPASPSRSIRARRRSTPRPTPPAGSGSTASSVDTHVIQAELPGFRALRQPLELRNDSDWNRPVTLQVGDLRGNHFGSGNAGQRR